jgi:hypothetical protein
MIKKCLAVVRAFVGIGEFHERFEIGVITCVF